MLYNDEERAVMADAIQPNMRASNISVKPFENIIADYIRDFSFSHANILDIGPGQLDFLDLARKGGAARTVGVDFDPAIQALGQLRRHEVFVADLRSEWPLQEREFDLIFCRGSINCYWYTNEDRLQTFLQNLSASLKRGGRLWIAPWNKPGEGREFYASTIDHVVGDWAEKRGIIVEDPPESLHARYGIGYKIPRVTIWRR